MVEFGSSILRRDKFFVAAVTAAFALLAPALSFAQSDQVIVLACTSPAYPTYLETITLDLVKKTETSSSEQNVNGTAIQTSDKGIVTQVSDQQIVWVVHDSAGARTFTLDRYTGRLLISRNGAIVSDTVTCQKHQKQF
jgi:hypothetical protein